MAKRTADKDLTHDNWDQDEEEEEAGVFRTASPDELKKREIKKAKRRGVTEERSSAGAFKGFSFGLTTSAFTGASVATSTFTSTAASAAAIARICSSKLSSGEPTTESQYRRNLRTLNESVIRWADDHIKANPYCILTPVFNDYNNYIKELGYDDSAQSDKVVGKAPVATNAAASGFSFQPSVGTTSTVTVSSSSSQTTSATIGAGFSFGTTTANSDGKPFAAPTSTTAATTGFSAGGFSFGTQDSKASTGFNFGTQTSKETTSGVSGFSFGAQPTTEAAFTSATGFWFSNPSAKDATSSSAPASETSSTAAPSEDGDDDKYVPPKTEVVDIKEDDAFYSVRCKLYFKISGEFKERGLGNLYLKPYGGKTQLLVRAETNLGNILLNIELKKEIPTSRQGDRVTMICIPNPPLDEKKPKEAVCVVIRVKKEEDAEALLKQINEHKA